MHKVAVFVGSLRRESINRKLAKALARLGQSRFTFDFVELGDLPMYNDDLWPDPPPSVPRLKADIAAADAVLLVTPENNRSIPAVLKNAIDWGSRPYGQNSWGGKPTAIVGASPGNVGTAVAQSHLRNIMAILGVKLMGQPEVYFVAKPGLIDEQNEISEESTRDFLKGFLTRFDAWIGAFASDKVKAG